VEKRIPPSARLEQAIAGLVEDGNWEPDSLAELGRLGAQLMIQRAVDEERTPSWDAHTTSARPPPGRATATAYGHGECRQPRASLSSKCLR